MPISPYGSAPYQGRPSKPMFGGLLPANQWDDWLRQKVGYQVNAPTQPSQSWGVSRVPGSTSQPQNPRQGYKPVGQHQPVAPRQTRPRIAIDGSLTDDRGRSVSSMDEWRRRALGLSPPAAAPEPQWGSANPYSSPQIAQRSALGLPQADSAQPYDPFKDPSSPLYTPPGTTPPDPFKDPSRPYSEMPSPFPWASQASPSPATAASPPSPLPRANKYSQSENDMAGRWNSAYGPTSLPPADYAESLPSPSGGDNQSEPSMFNTPGRGDTADYLRKARLRSELQGAYTPATDPQRGDPLNVYGSQIGTVGNMPSEPLPAVGKWARNAELNRIANEGGSYSHFANKALAGAGPDAIAPGPAKAYGMGKDAPRLGSSSKPIPAGAGPEVYERLLTKARNGYYLDENERNALARHYGSRLSGMLPDKPEGAALARPGDYGRRADRLRGLADALGVGGPSGGAIPTPTTMGGPVASAPMPPSPMPTAPIAPRPQAPSSDANWGDANPNSSPTPRSSDVANDPQQTGSGWGGIYDSLMTGINNGPMGILLPGEGRFPDLLTDRFKNRMQSLGLPQSPSNQEPELRGSIGPVAPSSSSAPEMAAPSQPQYRNTLENRADQNYGIPASQSAGAPSSGASPFSMPSAVPVPDYMSMGGAQPVDDMLSGRDYIQNMAQTKRLQRQNRIAGMDPRMAQLMGQEQQNASRGFMAQKGLMEQGLGNERNAAAMGFNSDMYQNRAREALGLGSLGLQDATRRDAVSDSGFKNRLLEQEQQRRQQMTDGFFGGAGGQQPNDPLRQAMMAESLFPGMGEVVMNHNARKKEQLSPTEDYYRGAVSAALEQGNYAEAKRIFQEGEAARGGGGAIAPSIPSAPKDANGNPKIDKGYIQGVMAQIPPNTPKEQVLAILKQNGINPTHLENAFDNSESPSMWSQWGGWVNRANPLNPISQLERLWGGDKTRARNSQRQKEFNDRLKALQDQSGGFGDWFTAPSTFAPTR